MKGQVLAVVSLLARVSCVSCASCASTPPSFPPLPPAPSAAAPTASSRPPPSTPDAPFRQSAPASAGPLTWSPPRIESWSLPNGVRVLFVERRELPIVAVRVVSSTGAGDLPGERAGAVAFMGAMLEQGAGKRGALELSDDYEALGADHAAWCDWDACVARLKVLSSRLAPALDLLADVALRPGLSDAEIERVRKRWLASLEQEKSSPAVIEQNAIAAVLYGRGHPYGHGLRGTPADVGQRRREEIERTWRRAFTPRSTTIVAAGDIATGELRGLLEARFGAFRGDAAARSTVPSAPPAPCVDHAQADPGTCRPGAGVRLALVDVPGAAQSQVFVAEPGVPFSSDDRIALGVMNAILGGMFSSRINLDLREAHAYTYGAHSRFSMRHGAGPFAAGGAIFTAHTGEAVRALLAHIVRIREEAVTDDELSDAKENAKLALPARFEGVDDVAGALQDLAVYGLPLDEYAIRAARIDAVTAQEVQRVAKKWLHPDTMRVVVTGDRAKIDADLAGLGPIELRDAYGDPVK